MTVRTSLPPGHRVADDAAPVHAAARAHHQRAPLPEDEEP